MNNNLLCLAKNKWYQNHQTTPQYVMKPYNARFCLTTDYIQTNTGCAKFMQLRFNIDYDWNLLGVWINCVQNASASNHLIVSFWSKTEYSRYVYLTCSIILNIEQTSYIKHGQNKKTTVDLVIAYVNIGFLSMTIVHYTFMKNGWFWMAEKHLITST